MGQFLEVTSTEKKEDIPPLHDLAMLASVESKIFGSATRNAILKTPLRTCGTDRITLVGSFEQVNEIHCIQTCESPHGCPHLGLHDNWNLRNGGFEDFVDFHIG